MNVLSTLKAPAKVLTKTAGKLMLKLNQNKPQIIFVTGIVVTAGSFVWAIANARKMNDVMSEKEGKVDDANMRIEAAKGQENLTEEEKKNIIVACNKELAQAKKEAAFEMFKLVGLPCMFFAGGLALSIGGHLILLRRFGEVSAAFASLQEIFDRYRKMNIEEHGAECDRRYRYGVVGDTTVTTEVTDDKGKTKQLKCKVPIVDTDAAASLYSFIFSEEFSRKCPKDPVSAISFLRAQEKYWNIWMEAKQKPVTLYMVLEELGIELDPDDPRNDYIMIAGWRPNGDGDNHIDFGIMRAVNRPALTMEENVVFLNFNCDGNLYHSTRYTKDGRKVC